VNRRRVLQATSFRLLGSFGSAGGSSHSVGQEAAALADVSKQPAEQHSDA
jgi:hypothetical protein